MIPEGWREGRVVDFFELQRGFDLTEKQSLPGKIPVISSSGVAYFHAEAKVPGPGVVTGRKGNIGSVYYVTEDFWPHDTTLWVRDFKGNVPEYVRYFLDLMRLERFDEASSVPTLNRNNVHGIKCHFPPSEEQTRIVKLLHAWEDAISLTERLICAKKELRTWLIQNLLRGKRRLPGFAHSQEKRKTPYGPLPLEWAYPRIGEIAKEVSERNGLEEDRPVLSCTKHKGLVDSLAYFGKRIFSEDLSNYKVVHQGQFAYATNHIDEGSIGYQNTYNEALISPIYTVFQTDATIDDRFLFLVLKTETYRHIFASNTSASVDRRGSLRWSDFAKIHVPRPSIDEQRAIVAVFKTIDSDLDLLSSQRAALLEQKKGLMQQLLTGKRRVKV
jgi:type I restriction enzyme S subunit